MLDFIERLKSKPEHVRRRIALGTASGITGVVALVWFVALIFSGNLSYTTAPSNDSGTLAQAGTAMANGANATKTNFGSLLGAVGVAVTPAAQPSLAPVDPTSSPSASSSQRTVIPF